MEPQLTTPHRKASTYGGLVIGVAGVSVAAILIRLADSPSLTVAAYRMGIAALVVAAIAFARYPHQIRLVRRADLPWLLAGGTFLALHFAAFITSLELTSVANSVLLVTTTPVFVAVASRWGFRDRLSRATVAAVIMSMAGGVVLAAGDWSVERSQITGDVLAVLGAVTSAGYFLVGRRVRASLPVAPYITVVYATAAVLLLGAALATHSPLTGLPATAYFWMAMLAIVSQVVGHSALNWSLGHLTATTVSLAIRAEPVIATLLAIPVLGETPPWTAGLGGLLVLAGVYLAVRAESPK